ncbi:hypothetical protein TNCV_2584921 [Trichonephila clavipes]|nr:hypothetical protein TNCV_2584921 [Trichonephila clavipes]
MDDNATCHRTRRSDCLDSAGYSTSRTASAFSRLENPIENVWDALGSKLLVETIPPTNKQEHPHPGTHRGMG